MSEASVVLADMFCLPQPVSIDAVSTADAYRDGLQVIRIAEDSEVLEMALRICYPTPNPEFDSLDDVIPLHELGVKYEMGVVTGITSRQIRILSEGEPLRAYAVALRHNLDEEARIAAKFFLRQPAPGLYVRELEDISGSALWHLQDYHARCVAAVRNLTLPNNFQWLDDKSWIWFKCREKVHCIQNQNIAYRLLGSWQSSVAHWWLHHMQLVNEELQKTPYGKVAIKSPDDAFRIAEEKTQHPCSSCRKSAHEQMAKFSNILAEQVEQVVSTVNFKK